MKQLYIIFFVILLLKSAQQNANVGIEIFFCLQKYHCHLCTIINFSFLERLKKELKFFFLFVEISFLFFSTHSLGRLVHHEIIHLAIHSFNFTHCVTLKWGAKFDVKSNFNFSGIYENQVFDKKCRQLQSQKIAILRQISLLSTLLRLKILQGDPN